ncbi:MAG: hypothetical protein L0Z53_00790 [Acidobacteriales bacterium]|nr:hypothetical protein [Terriglobales bacterium]
MSKKARDRIASRANQSLAAENERGTNLRVIRYRTGLKIRQTGIFTVHHAEHRLPHEVTLLKGETFPRCSQCGTSVEFELLTAAPEINGSGGFRVVLYELPAAEDVEEKSDAESA